ARILESRVKGTTTLVGALAGLAQKPSVLVSGSAIGFYGARGDEELDESSAGGTGFLADVVREWEAAAAPAADAGLRGGNARTRVVMARGGGGLKRQLPLFKLGVGGRLGSGKQWFSWISLEDEVRALVHAIQTRSLSGPVNLASPNPVTNAVFTRALA